jgi:polyhydroxyalkanoate synthesis regulator phasin
MPQPKSRSSAGKAAPAKDAGERNQIARLLNPLDLVLLTRDRLQDVFDDAVARGRMTRDDATDIVNQILQRGRRTTEDAIADLEQLLGRSREQIEGATADVARRVDRARRATGIGSLFPIGDYDDLTAAQVQSKLAGLTPAELRKVRDYERRNANRKSVLAAIESKLS